MAQKKKTTPSKKKVEKKAAPLKPNTAKVSASAPIASVSPKAVKTVEPKKPSKAKAGKPVKEARRVVAEVIHHDDADESSIQDSHQDEDAYHAQEAEEIAEASAAVEEGDADIETDSESDSDSEEIAKVPAKGAGKAVATTTDPVSLYLAEVRKYPLLSREQESELAKKYFETKDPVAAQALVTANLRFVVKVAAEYSRFGARMIDLIQEGNMGLMHGVREFNPYKGVRLITYAVWWIRGYIQEYLMKQYSLVKIGTTQNQKKLFYQLQRQKEELDALGKSPDIKMLSSKLGIPEDEVEMMAQRMSGRDVSLDRPVDDESGSSLMDFQKIDTHMPDEDIAQKEEMTHLNEAIEALKPLLSDREKIILDERILADEPLTLQEIGEKYGITREAVRQMETRLMKKIKDQYQK